MEDPPGDGRERSSDSVDFAAEEPPSEQRKQNDRCAALKAALKAKGSATEGAERCAIRARRS